MAKPNYQYEKRQRDLAKKKKKDEKLKKKQLTKDQPDDASDAEFAQSATDGASDTP
ncbi:MAG: hypothetical protein L0H70_02165 [Xanthomonadales bacterium]|nr:hypothetical protein [Xanthomonadales bacterium]